jgi:hypothetical protein
MPEADTQHAPDGDTLRVEETEVTLVLTVPCGYGVDHDEHEFPEDWVFGGANGLDPRADARWRPTTYTYFSERLDVLAATQTPLCDDQAIDEFTVVSTYGPAFNPKYIYALRPGADKPERLMVTYDKATDTVTEEER